MEKNHDKVILFPKWKKTLEDESLLALEHKKYDEALAKLNQLLSYDINKHEIFIGKLICLMELDRYDEAQVLCETLLKQENENYYHYLHIYLTILFQTSQYQLLMEQIEHEFAMKSIPEDMNEQFQQLYDMSMNMRLEIQMEKSTEYINELSEAVKGNDHRKQWRLIEELHKLKATPTKATQELLTNKTIHPVTKTAIFQWLQEMDIMEMVEIDKLDLHMSVKPAAVTPLKAHTMIKQTLLIINELEQENPSLFYLIEKLLHRYVYVRYPIMPCDEHVQEIAEALQMIGNQYLNLHTNEHPIHNETILRYIKEIQMCETLYLSIIDE